MSHRPSVFFPGKVQVTFRRGALGYLLQVPSDAAKKIKDNPSMQDKSAPLKEEVVRKNAISVVLQRGGDVSDKAEVLGEYILQFGKYRGKSFRWLLENDVGYTMYLIKNLEKEKEAGHFSTEGSSKISLQSFLEYAMSFKDIEELSKFESHKTNSPAVTSDCDTLVGFGNRAKSTWGEIWESRADGYAFFIMSRKCGTGSKMHKLQQYLLMKKESLPSTVTSPASTATPYSQDSPASAAVGAPSVSTGRGHVHDNMSIKTSVSMRHQHTLHVSLGRQHQHTLHLSL
ncbi:uncharacterized protein LOC106023952 [Esox lucius]|uniref:uncharacterized protein LOC114830314 n=1 Tax=Esox lucius TaxID=8010 RepID=UPI0010BD6490|nr:uncharacterized protein LOC114830314 [Esox lucius]XP_028974387.2 uncharacterized protein LOC106023952 [Esox lucius]